jgi:hypothetical protein
LVVLWGLQCEPQLIWEALRQCGCVDSDRALVVDVQICFIDNLGLHKLLDDILNSDDA